MSSLSSSGTAPYYRMARGWLDHPVLNAGQGPRGVRHFAWAWLIDRAAWADRVVTVGGRVVQLQRGELLASQLTMQQEWGWTRTTVQRFLAELQAAGMIAWREASPERGPVPGPVSGPVVGPVPRVIVICNYSTYQASVPMLGPVNGPVRGPVNGHSESKEEEGSIKMGVDSPPAPVRTREPAEAPVKLVSDRDTVGAVFRPPRAAFGQDKGHFDEHQRAMIQAFDDARAAAFGPALARPWPHQLDGVTAGRWLAAGGEKGWEPAQTIALARSVIGPVHQKLAGQGKDPPGTLSFHDTDIRRALRAATEPPKEDPPHVAAHARRPAVSDAAPRRHYGLDPRPGYRAALAAVAARRVDPGASPADGVPPGD